MGEGRRSMASGSVGLLVAMVLSVSALLAWPAALVAEEAAPSMPASTTAAALDEKAAVLLAEADEGDAARFGEALALAFEREAGLAGFALSSLPFSGDDASEPEVARRAASERSARWVLVARCKIEGDRVLWRAAVYDGSDGSLLGADVFSAYAGLSALPLIAQSASNAMRAAILARDAPPREEPIQRRLAFASEDEGASVLLGSAGPGALPLGSIADGRLEAPYLPFRPGQRFLVSVEKGGYWPASFRARVGESDDAIRLPRLMRKTENALVLSYGTGRLLGAAAAYRWYPLPDALYIRGEDSFWAAYDFLPGSRPVLHDEIRLGAGAYLFLPPSSRFRISAGSGLSGIFTLLTASGPDERTGFDLCIEPVFYTLEWHWPTWALVLEQRFPYSLGLDCGFLPREWLSLGGKGPIFISLGAMLKW